MSNTPCPDDAASFPQAESSEEELDHAMSDEDCEVCRCLRLPDPYSLRTTYAKLWSAVADGCELCELLQRVSESACAGADMTIQGTDRVHVKSGVTEVKESLTVTEVNYSPIVTEVKESLSWLRVEALEAGTFQGSLHFCLTRYTSCTDTADWHDVYFYAALGRE